MESMGCAETIGRNEKACVDCNTSKTPLWRSGPAGPKSLCNACGIRYRKKSEVRSDKKKEKPPPTPTPSRSLSSSSSCTNAVRKKSFRNREMDVDGGGEMNRCDLRKKLRINVVAMGKEVVLLRRQRSPTKVVKRQKIEKFGEVEEAAFVLMSLSYGLVFG